MQVEKPVVVVTGAGGFVGRYVVQRLLEQGDVHVRCMVRDKSAAPLFEPNNDISYCVADILKPTSLPSAFAGAWAVINLAGYREFWSRNRKDFYRCNETGATNVFKACLDAKVKRVIQVSTPLAYGVPATLPFNENTLAGPHPSDYARSKYLGDEAGWKLYENKGLPLSIVYLAAVIGAGDTKSTMEVGRALEGDMPALIGADTTYTYLFVRDAAEAIVRTLFKEDGIGKRYLIGTERATTREYFEIIGKIANVKIPKRNIPEKVLMPVAKAMENISRISGKRPLLPLDVLKTTAAGSLLFDGSLAKDELGMEYTALPFALADAIQGIQNLSR
jgi:dihydroflavonol-4-reductase